MSVLSVVMDTAKKFAAILSVAVLFTGQDSSAFKLSGSKWFGGAATYYVDMEGMSATQISWNTAFIEAMNDWTEQSIFDFTVEAQNADPCLDNDISSVDFSDTHCGSEFGSNVLAITLRRFASQPLGPPYIREADIVVNSEVEFNIFDGNIVQFGVDGLDFRRVALHELGHVIGLDHESGVEAIMAPSIGDLFQLQTDDIAGVEALYTGLSKCTVRYLSFGQVTEALDQNDCTVEEMTVGGTDDSFLDLYRFDLTETTALEFSATSSDLDTVLLLATTDLEYLEVDIASPEDCDSNLSVSLDAGSYFLIVNTFDEPIKEECGNVGSYSLLAEFTSDAPPSLGGSASLENTFNTASFSGGVSANNGQSFGNVFSPEDSLDIYAEIRVGGSHIGRSGFLVVAILTGDQILMLNSQGEPVDVTNNPLPPVRFASGALQPVEYLNIATDLVPAEIGIQELEANIVVGYGLDSNPNNLFFHQAPLNLTIR